MNKLLKHIISIILIACFLVHTSAFSLDLSSELLSPPLRSGDRDFGTSLTAAAICKFIERDGNLDSTAYLEDVLSRLDADRNPDITVLPHEIIIEIPREGMAVRYFDPTRANVVTPFSDISKLRTKVINDRLWRQVISRPKAITGSKLAELTDNVDTLKNELSELAQKVFNPVKGREPRYEEIIEALKKKKEEEGKKREGKLSPAGIDYRRITYKGGVITVLYTAKDQKKYPIRIIRKTQLQKTEYDIDDDFAVEIKTRHDESFVRLAGSALEELEKDKCQEGKVVDLRDNDHYKGRQVVLISDLHGKPGNLEQILREIGWYEKSKKERPVLAIAGDAVHISEQVLPKKPDKKNYTDLEQYNDDLEEYEAKFNEMSDSIELIRKIFELKRDDPENVFYMIGNHDNPHFFKTRKPVSQNTALQIALLEQVGNEGLETYIKFLDKSPLLFLADNLVVCHGGPVKGKALERLKERARNEDRTVLDILKEEELSLKNVDPNEEEEKMVLENGELVSPEIDDLATQLTLNMHRLYIPNINLWYTSEDVMAFLGALEMPDATFVTGHDHDFDRHKEHENTVNIINTRRKTQRIGDAMSPYDPPCEPVEERGYCWAKVRDCRNYIVFSGGKIREYGVLDPADEQLIWATDKDTNVLKEATKKMRESRESAVRDINRNGEPGQLIKLKAERLIVIGDLHSEYEAFDAVISKIMGEIPEDEIMSGRTQIILSGDYIQKMSPNDFESFRDSSDRYKYDTYEDYKRDAGVRVYNLIQRIAELKIKYGNGFHVLPGNGDLSFMFKLGGEDFRRLFTDEDENVLKGKEELFEAAKRFVDSMPSFAIATIKGKNRYLISHGGVVQRSDQQEEPLTEEQLRDFERHTVDDFIEREEGGRTRIRALDEINAGGVYWVNHLKEGDLGGKTQKACADLDVECQISGHVHLFGEGKDTEVKALGIEIKEMDGKKIAYGVARGSKMHVLNSMSFNGRHAYLEITGDEDEPIRPKAVVPRTKAPLVSPSSLRIHDNIIKFAEDVEREIAAEYREDGDFDLNIARIIQSLKAYIPADQFWGLVLDENHGFMHGIQSIKECVELAEKYNYLEECDIHALVLGAFLHDIYGAFLYDIYSDSIKEPRREGHNVHGAEQARDILERMKIDGFLSGEINIDKICFIIRMHNQSPEDFRRQGLGGQGIIEGGIVHDAETLFEGRSEEIVIAVSMVDKHRKFFEPGLGAAVRVDKIRERNGRKCGDDRDIKDDALTFLLRNATRNCNPDYYVLEKIKAMEDELLIESFERSLRKILYYAAQYGGEHYPSIRNTIFGVIDGYWEEEESNESLRSKIKEVTDNYRNKEQAEALESCDPYTKERWGGVIRKGGYSGEMGSDKKYKEVIMGRGEKLFLITDSHMAGDTVRDNIISDERGFEDYVPDETTFPGRKVFKVDHHYVGENAERLNGMTATSIIIDYILYLHGSGQKETLEELGSAFYLVNHVDADSVLSVIAARMAKDIALHVGKVIPVEFTEKFDFMKDVSIYNDYYLLPSRGDEGYKERVMAFQYCSARMETEKVLFSEAKEHLEELLTHFEDINYIKNNGLYEEYHQHQKADFDNIEKAEGEGRLWRSKDSRIAMVNLKESEVPFSESWIKYVREKVDKEVWGPPDIIVLAYIEKGSWTYKLRVFPTGSGSSLESHGLEGLMGELNTNNFEDNTFVGRAAGIKARLQIDDGQSYAHSEEGPSNFFELITNLWGNIDKEGISPDRGYERYIDERKGLLSKIINTEGTIVLRVPIEVMETAAPENIRSFLNAFQEAPNAYVELYTMTGTGAVSAGVYRKYGINRKALPADFDMTRENTLTLFPVLKGEEITQTTVSLRLGELGLGPADTVLSPVGLQGDPAGLVRSTILGLGIMKIAREIGQGQVVDQKYRDKVQVEMLELYKNICDPDDIKNFDLTPDDIIALAIEDNINKVTRALQKLVKLLPITPIDAEELRQIYEHARQVLLAA